MDTDITTTEDKIEKAVADTPVEVLNFMWGDAYAIIMDAMQKTLSLTDIQKEKVGSLGQDLLLGLKNMENITEELVTIMPAETVMKVLFILDSEVITRAENITEYFSPDPDEALGDVPQKQSVQDAPQQDILESLKAKLIQPATIAPVARDHSMGSAATPPQNTPGTKPSAVFDPYREKPL